MGGHTHILSRKICLHELFLDALYAMARTSAAQFYDRKDKVYCINVLQAGGTLNIMTSSRHLRSKEGPASHSPLEGVHVRNVPLTESERLFTLKRALLGRKGVVSYRCDFFLAGKEVVVSQVHHVHARDNGNWFRKVVAVWEIQVEHVTDLGVLWMVNKTEIYCKVLL